MNQKNLSAWLKGIVFAMAVAGILLYLLFVPFIGNDAIVKGTLTSFEAFAWFFFLLPSAIPCYLVLYWCWNASRDIGRDACFTGKNARRLKHMMYASLVDTAYLFLGNMVFLLIGASTPTIFAIFSFVDFAGVVFSVAAGCLSHLVYKAAKMREENESFV